MSFAIKLLMKHVTAYMIYKTWDMSLNYPTLPYGVTVAQEALTLLV